MQSLSLGHVTPLRKRRRETTLNGYAESFFGPRYSLRKRRRETTLNGYAKSFFGQRYSLRKRRRETTLNGYAKSFFGQRYRPAQAQEGDDSERLCRVFLRATLPPCACAGRLGG